MSRWQRDRRFRWASFIILSAGSGVLLFQDEPRARLVGIIGLLMFGGGGLALAAGELASKRAGPMSRGRVQLPSGVVTRGLIIPMRAGRMRGGYVALAFILAASVLMVLSPEVFGDAGGVMRWLVGGVAVVLAIVLAAAIPRLLGPSPVLALTRTGLSSRSYAGTVFFPWDVISRVQILDFRGQITLGVDVSSRAGVEQEGAPRVLGWLDRPIVGLDAGIPLVGTPLPPDEIVALIQRYIDEPTRREELDD